VRTDSHARLLRERADELDQLASHAPGLVGKRLRADANRLRETAAIHDTTARPTRRGPAPGRTGHHLQREDHRQPESRN